MKNLLSLIVLSGGCVFGQSPQPLPVQPPVVIPTPTPIQTQPPFTSIIPGDSRCTGIVQSDPSWGTVQVGQQIICAIPISVSGLYSVTVLTKEPLSTITAGQRVFSVTINGHQFPGIDIARLLNQVNTEYEINTTVVAEKLLVVTLSATARTAIFTQIIIRPTLQ